MLQTTTTINLEEELEIAILAICFHLGTNVSFRKEEKKNLRLLKWDFKSLSLPFRLIKTFIFLTNTTTIR